MIIRRYKYLLAFLILPLLFGCISNSGESKSGDYNDEDLLTPQEVSIREMLWPNEDIQGFDPNSNEVLITNVYEKGGFSYTGNDGIEGYLTFPLRSDQTLDSVKYTIKNETLMIFINLKEASNSSDTGKNTMTVYIRIINENIYNITESTDFEFDKFKKPVKVFINGRKAKVINGEQVYKPLICGTPLLPY